MVSSAAGCRCTSGPGASRSGVPACGRDAAYLVRPDGYVALADAAGHAAAIASYLDSRRIKLAT